MIYDILLGLSRPVTIDELMEITDMTNRAVRRQIEAERKKGAPIINLQDGKGYFAGNEEQIGIQIRLLKHRACELLKIAGKMSQAKKNKALEQVELF